jgi:hypothetical protein
MLEVGKTYALRLSSDARVFLVVRQDGEDFTTLILCGRDDEVGSLVRCWRGSSFDVLSKELA